MTHARRHLTYANVVSSLCLFLLLGGGAAWAVDGPLAGQNTVGSADIINGEVQTDDIRDGNLTTNDIRSNAVTSGKVLDDNLTGNDINESSLGFECPAGYERAGKDVCYDNVHIDANFPTALSTCADGGDRLPTLAEAMSVMTDLPTPGDEELHLTWTTDHSSGAEAITLRKNEFGVISRSSVTTTLNREFRCVTSPHG